MNTANLLQAAQTAPDHTMLFVPYLHAPGGRTQRLPPDPLQQVFSFTTDDDASTWHFDIERLLVLIREAKPPFDDLQCREFAIRPVDIQHITRNNGIETDGVRRVQDNVVRLNEPGLMAMLPDGSQIIIDGNHRMVARYNRRRPAMRFYCLTPAQWRLSLLDGTGLLVGMPDAVLGGVG